MRIEKYSTISLFSLISYYQYYIMKKVFLSLSLLAFSFTLFAQLNEVGDKATMQYRANKIKSTAAFADYAKFEKRNLEKLTEYYEFYYSASSGKFDVLERLDQLEKNIANAATLIELSEKLITSYEKSIVLLEDAGIQRNDSLTVIKSSDLADVISTYQSILDCMNEHKRVLPIELEVNEIVSKGLNGDVRVLKIRREISEMIRELDKELEPLTSKVYILGKVYDLFVKNEEEAASDSIN